MNTGKQGEKMKKNFWKNKLMAYLHDPPHKPYGIANHSDTIKSNLLMFGITEDDMKQFEDKYISDAFAASADRFIFPNPRKGNLRTNWKEEGAPYIHPFCGTHIKPHIHPVTRDVAEDWMSSALSNIINEQTPSKENFIKAWRLWEKELIKTQKEVGIYMPYLVADTRIPDHTIWQHNALTAAIAACNGKPAFLLFQLGPVQSFIAQAKTTRDLWAGSYILSYLNAKAIFSIADKYGPDHIIFPQIKGNPIIDEMFWDIYGKNLNFTEQAKAKWERKQRLIPSLPNRFMALIPGDDLNIEREIKECVKAEWHKIEKSVRDFMNKEIGNEFPNWDELWDEQVKCFPRMDTMLHLFEQNDVIVDEFLNDRFPPFENPELHSTIQNLNWALKSIPDEYKDSRCYAKGNLSKIDNLGFTWALQYLKAEWKFGALRNSRTFEQRFDFKEFSLYKRKVEKDPLDGINEVLGGKENKKFWLAVSKHEKLGSYFKGKQRYGAMSIIKRLFAKAYLNQEDVYDNNSELRIKSTYEIATGKKIDNDDQLSEEDKKYYAIICFDGDDMGKWLSGEKSQPVSEQLLGKEIKDFLKKHANKNLKRAVTPSYHLTFSEALANFANYCVEPIISSFNGQLIYAGGDDVLAMVPADSAIDCAEALQYAFRGIKPQDTNSVLFEIFDYEWCEMEKEDHIQGFLKIKNPGSARPTHPLLMPGNRATASAGIAVGHIKSPMQDLIQTAREAEQKAKQSGKNGFSLTIKKRSGETNSFFAHWDSGNLLSAWKELSFYLRNKDISNRFPYVYTQYIYPLLRNKGGKYIEEFDDNILGACYEYLRITTERQGERSKINFKILFKKLEHTSPANYINFWMCLAFMNRINEGDE